MEWIKIEKRKSTSERSRKRMVASVERSNEGKEEAVGPLDSLTEREVRIVGDIENGFGSNVEGGREEDEDVTIL